MRLGIRKIEWIFASSLQDYSAIAPGVSVNIDAFVKEGKSFSELPFTPDTASVDEEWVDDGNGQYSKLSLSASIRKDRMQYSSLLARLTGRKTIWKVTLIDGNVYIIGSPEYLPKLTDSNSISGYSSSEFAVSIQCESKHGMLLCE